MIVVRITCIKPIKLTVLDLSSFGISYFVDHTQVGDPIKRILSDFNQSDSTCVIQQTFKPSVRIDFQITPAFPTLLAQVGIPVRRTVSLFNQSDGVLRYSLDCSAAPDDQPPEQLAFPVEFTSPASAAAAGTGPALRGIEMWVDEPEGTIPAKASKSVTVTFFPRYRKDYSLLLSCKTSTVVALGAPAGGRPPSGGGGSRPAAADAAAAVSAPLTARATFPLITVSDVFSECRAKPLVWGMFGCSELNVELSSHVTATELQLNAMQDKGTLTTESACDALRPFVLDFGILVGDHTG